MYNTSASSLGGIFGLALSSREVNHTIYHNTILIGDNTNQVTSNIIGGEYVKNRGAAEFVATELNQMKGGGKNGIK